MSLERVGNSQALQAMLKRIREIQARNAAHPEESAKRDAEIDADRARMAAMTKGATHAFSEPKPQPGKFSREGMRVGADREDGELL